MKFITQGELNNAAIYVYKKKYIIKVELGRGREIEINE